MTTIIGLIRTQYNTFSPSQKRVADYVLAHPEEVMMLSMSELAAKAKVSDPTIMRFLHKLNYQSYQVFRVMLAQENAVTPSQALYNDIEKEDSSKEIIQKVITLTHRALDDLHNVLQGEELESFCQSILKAKRILVIGVGSTAAIAFDLTHKLLKLSISAQSMNDPHMINIACGTLGEEDLLIALSHSGESREILDGVKLAKEAGAKVLAITSMQDSSLAREAQQSLFSSSFETSYRSDSMVSRILQLCIIDMIYIRLALLGGYAMQKNINRSRIAVAQNKT